MHAVLVEEYRAILTDACCTSGRIQGYILTDARCTSGRIRGRIQGYILTDACCTSGRRAIY